MNLKSIITTAAFAFLASLASGSAKAQNCQFIGVYEIYDNCYLRVTTCGSSTIGSGCSSGGHSAAKGKGANVTKCQPPKQLEHPPLKSSVPTEPKETE